MSESRHATPQLGDRLSVSRSFTVEEVEAFVRISGDRGVHHVVPDADGRLMVHGLLTATLFTEVGGRLNYLAREMTFEFVRPVFTGDVIAVEFVVDEAVPGPGRLALAGHAVATNQHGKEVMRATTRGVILTP